MHICSQSHMHRNTDTYRYWSTNTNTLKQNHIDLLLDRHKGGGAVLYAHSPVHTELSTHAFQVTSVYRVQLYFICRLYLWHWTQIPGYHKYIRILFPSLKVKYCYNNLDLLRPRKTGLRHSGTWKQENYHKNITNIIKYDKNILATRWGQIWI